MLYHFRWCLLIVLLCGKINLIAQPMSNSVKRVLFLGNSITWDGRYVNDVEAYLRAQFPQRQWEFINVGLSSETVSGLSEVGYAGGSFPRPDLHERLTRVLQQTNPDVVFACYGMNDGIYMPLDLTRFEKFKDGISWLHDEVEKTGARIIHLTPPDYDEERGKNTGYAAVLDRYAQWILSKRKLAEWEVIDIHFPMKKYLQAHRKIDKKFAVSGFALATDGVHPGDLGHWLIAREILSYLGHREVARAPGIVESLPQIKNGAEYVKLVKDRQNMLRDAWLTATKHKRPGVPAGLRLPEAEMKAARLLLAIQASTATSVAHDR
jgi:lysophospholipase L1-like esterase